MGQPGTRGQAAEVIKRASTAQMRQEAGKSRQRLTKIVRAQRLPLIGSVARLYLLMRGVVIPREVEVGPGLVLAHGALGTVVHPSTKIGSDVTIYQGVTIGERDISADLSELPFCGVIIGDRAVIGAGACVLAKGDKPLVVGAGTVVGANAVLLSSTGPREVWAGVPASKIGSRDDGQAR